MDYDSTVTINGKKGEKNKMKRLGEKLACHNGKKWLQTNKNLV
jgi:hypothetical protein